MYSWLGTWHCDNYYNSSTEETLSSTTMNTFIQTHDMFMLRKPEKQQDCTLQQYTSVHKSTYVCTSARWLVYTRVKQSTLYTSHHACVGQCRKQTKTEKTSRESFSPTAIYVLTYFVTYLKTFFSQITDYGIWKVQTFLHMFKNGIQHFCVLNEDKLYFVMTQISVAVKLNDSPSCIWESTTAQPPTVRCVEAVGVSESEDNSL